MSYTEKDISSFASIQTNDEKSGSKIYILFFPRFFDTGSSMADIVFSGMNHLIGSREEQETVLLDGITSSSSSSARRKEKEINMRERNKIKQNRKGEKSSNFDPISYFDPKKKKNVLRRSDLVQERYHPHPVRCHSNRTTFENVLEPSQRNLP